LFEKVEVVMTSKPVYQLSARQLLLLAFAAALIAVGATALIYSLGSLWKDSDSATTFAETIRSAGRHLGPVAGFR
jgi:hypothetical protein